MQPGRVDVAVADECGDRVHAQRMQRPATVRAGTWRRRRGDPRSGCVTLSSSSRVIPIANSCDLRRAAKQEPEEVDGALVGPVQIVENQDRRPALSSSNTAAKMSYGRSLLSSSSRVGGAELVCQIVQWAQRPRRRQRVTCTPQHARGHRRPDRRTLRRTWSCPHRIHRTPSRRRRVRRELHPPGSASWSSSCSRSVSVTAGCYRQIATPSSENTGSA